MSDHTLEIISPVAGKGLGRPFKKMDGDEYVDESEHVYLGLIVRNAKGVALRDSVVEVVATDESQNASLEGTGNVTKWLVNGEYKKTPFYPFDYKFKTAGEHTITFKAHGLETSVTIEVSEPAQ